MSRSQRSTPHPGGSSDASEILRAFILGIFLFGMVGMTLELILLEHYDEIWQWTPFVLFGTSTLVLLWYGFTRRALAIRVFRMVMVAFVAGGALGVYLHYDSNVMFEREMSPDVLGWALFREAIFGATPALAPGVMVQLGLLGLAFTIRHPALEAWDARRRGRQVADEDPSVDQHRNARVAERE